MAASSAAPSSDQSEPPAVRYIRLESQEGHIFVIDEDAAMKASLTISAMFAPEIKGLLTDERPIQFKDISTAILEKVCQYFYYKKRYATIITEKIPDFEIAPEIALELLMAANFLDC